MASTGSISWIDLTVPDAVKIREFYSEVVGWRTEPVSMGEYDDFNMIRPSNSEAVAGVCHARGGNADLPAKWLIYITVEDLDRSIARCEELGGKVIAGPRNAGGEGRFCVIEDPAGAVAALYSDNG